MARVPPIPIQSLSIPNHSPAVPSSSTSSSNPVLYQIRISTSQSTYTVPHRYSTFLQLHSQLESLASPLPAPLPPKSSLFSIHSTDLNQRRLGLESYLRAIVGSKNAIWFHSDHFQEFIKPPTGSLSNQVLQSHKEWTSQTWLAAHSNLVSLSKTLQALLSRRDFLISSPATSAQAHGVNAEVKKGLVDLVRQIGDLKKGLEELERRGMVQGEIGRRRDMIGKLEDEVDTVGVLIRSGPKIGVGSRRTGEDLAPSGDKNTLFASASRPSAVPSGRVLGLGGGGKPVETKETRALDNQGLMQLQQGYMDNQDQRLEELTASLRRQRDLGNMIGEELAIQEDTMRDLERGIERVENGLGGAGKIMKRLGT